MSPKNVAVGIVLLLVTFALLLIAVSMDSPVWALVVALSAIAVWFAALTIGTHVKGRW